jgi:uncharacterized membrane protein
MGMDSAAETLLIVVSATLTVLLLLLIVALVYIIKILKQIRRISIKAETVVDSVESAASTFQKAAAPSAILTLISNIVDKATKTRKGKD